MGDYTELCISCEFKEDVTDEFIINDIKPAIAEISNSSYYSAFPKVCECLYKDGIFEQWHLSLRCSIKNYDRELEQFIEFIKPYVSGSGENDNFLGYLLFERWESPVLLWTDKEIDYEGMKY